MKSSLRLLLATLSVLLLLSGCQGIEVSCLPEGEVASSVAPVYPRVDFAKDLAEGRLVRRVDQILFLVDDTESMTGCFSRAAKGKHASALLREMNASIRGLGFDTGLRLFGPEVEAIDDVKARLLYGLNHLEESKIRTVLPTRTAPGAMLEPSAMALDAAYQELKQVQGGTAVLLLSDFSRGKDEILTEVQLINTYYNGRVCVSPVLVGDDPAGWAVAQEIAQVGCGRAARASDLQGPEAMREFLKKVLFSEVEPVRAAAVQEAPQTYEKTGLSYERLLKEKAISIELKTQFDFDQAAIRAEYLGHLEEIARFMQAHPDVRTIIEGHTCSMGSEAYNLKLSRRRAEVVRDHLVGTLGIAANRLEVAPYGESKPVADNATREGRERNRRAVATLVATLKEGVDPAGKR